MIWREDAELKDWVWNLPDLGKDAILSIGTKAQRFIHYLGFAVRNADHGDYAILRPALLELKKKYPQYDRREGTANVREL